MVNLSNRMKSRVASDKRTEKQTADTAITSMAMNPVIEKTMTNSAKDDP
jgi:hypothetical protein